MFVIQEEVPVVPVAVHDTAHVMALRPGDGGVADRRDVGSFAGHAFGVQAAPVPTRP